jgi:3-isopropylmalate/(R)-2-methylmalate dehydratase small subunit
MRKAELGGVIAESAAITMVQKAVNSGFPVLEMAGIAALAETGDELEVDLRKGEAKNLTTGASIQITPLPEMIVEILEAGGLEQFAIRRLRQ